jgi:hypothetical protein
MYPSEINNLVKGQKIYAKITDIYEPVIVDHIIAVMNYVTVYYNGKLYRRHCTDISIVPWKRNFKTRKRKPKKVKSDE